MFAVVVAQLTQACRFVVSDSQDFCSVGQGSDDACLYILVVFQQLDGQKTGRVFVADIFVFTDFPFYVVDAPFNFRSVVDVDVADKTFGGEVVFFACPFILMSGHIGIVPFAEVAENFVLDFFFLPHEVGSFIQADDDVEQVVNAFTRTAYRRHHGYSQQFAQLVVVQFVAAVLQGIVHVQCHYHAHVHINKLGREVEITFQVACIHYVDDNVGCFLDDVFTHIEFFRAVGRKGVSTRQVHQTEVITLKIKETLFGIYGHTAVVAHVFVST